VQEFRDDLRRMLGISLAGIKLKRGGEFEHPLMGRKKRRKVKDLETLKYLSKLNLVAKYFRLPLHAS